MRPFHPAARAPGADDGPSHTAILVSFLVLVPTVVIGSHALLSIETVHGLENKMTGSVGLDPSKQ